MQEIIERVIKRHGQITLSVVKRGPITQQIRMAAKQEKGRMDHDSRN